jgi:hypothetical protein
MPRRRAPLRENAFRFVGIGVGAVLGIVIDVVVLPRHDAKNVLPWWVWGIFIVVVAAIGLAATAGGLAIGRRIVGDRIEAALRKPGGKWRHGRFTLTGDSVVFEQYRFQMRIPSGKKLELDDVRLGEDTGKRPPLRKLWTINPQLHIVTLDARQGHYEIGALPSRIAEFQERLQEPQLQ